jgi:hypothetical protein
MTISKIATATMVSIKVEPRSDRALFFRQRFPDFIPAVLRSSPTIFQPPEF